MAFPPLVTTGQIVASSHINSIRNSLITWGGNVSGGGNNLSSVGSLSAASGAFTGAVSAASVALSGSISAASLQASSTVPIRFTNSSLAYIECQAQNVRHYVRSGGTFAVQWVKNDTGIVGGANESEVGYLATTGDFAASGVISGTGRVSANGFGATPSLDGFFSPSAPGVSAYPLSSQGLLSVGARGLAGGAYSGQTASLFFRATQNWNASAFGTDILIATTATGSTTAANRLHIHQDGISVTGDIVATNWLKVTLPGPYADNAAAVSAGIPAGVLYLSTSNVVKQVQ